MVTTRIGSDAVAVFYAAPNGAELAVITTPEGIALHLDPREDGDVDAAWPAREAGENVIKALPATATPRETFAAAVAAVERTLPPQFTAVRVQYAYPGASEAAPRAGALCGVFPWSANAASSAGRS